MFTLHIEHPVPSYEQWKASFDADPLGREKSGVRQHRVLRALDDPNHVAIELDFDDRAQAEAMLEALRGLWGRVGPEGLIGVPQARIFEAAESREY